MSDSLDPEPVETAGGQVDERVFEALPPAQGRGFAQTWWGRRWLTALEDTALDGAQLKRGRAQARSGAVGAVSVRPGRVTAVVRDRDGTSYRSDVLVQQLGDAEWERLLGVAAGEAGHLAALLDGELPPRLVEDAAATGVELLPGIGDLEAECECGAWDHCPHSAALSYQVARLLDRDPFVLLLVRGRGEGRLLAELGERSTQGGAMEQREAPAEVPATEVYASGEPTTLPEPPEPVTAPGPALALSGGTQPAPGLDVAALEFLAVDAARRAQRLLVEALAPGHEHSAPTAPLTLWQDTVRLAAARPHPRIADRLAAGCESTDLASAVAAWECGGPDALTVWEDRWTPGPEALAQAHRQLATAWADDEDRPHLRVTGNHWTAVGTAVQLRYGPDGRWWPFRKERGRWWPAGGPDHHPATALTVLLREGT